MLSSFAYSAFQKKMNSKCNKEQVELITVVAAFSSLLGFYKYQGLKISSHQKAALVLARRGLNFKESIRIFKSTSSQQVVDLSTPTDCELHAWKFLSTNRLAIRRLLKNGNSTLFTGETIFTYWRFQSLQASLRTWVKKSMARRENLRETANASHPKNNPEPSVRITSVCNS